jgi:hypothetical protein
VVSRVYAQVELDAARRRGGDAAAAERHLAKLTAEHGALKQEAGEQEAAQRWLVGDYESRLAAAVGEIPC